MLQRYRLLGIGLGEGKNMAAHYTYDTEPEILEMPSQKMAAVYARGTPEQVLPRVLPDLYSSIYALKIELEKQGLSTFTVGGLRARYPDAHLVPVTEWTNVIGLPVPESTVSMPQKIGGNEIIIETWEYGTVGQILLNNLYHLEMKAIERLHLYIIDKGYEIIGVHEEEHLNQPQEENPCVLIRYRIMEKQHAGPG
jgi:hypothetical protein